jgi:hypothetical protein
MGQEIGRAANLLAGLALIAWNGDKMGPVSPEIFCAPSIISVLHSRKVASTIFVIRPRSVVAHSSTQSIGESMASPAAAPWVSCAHLTTDERKMLTLFSGLSSAARAAVLGLLGVAASQQQARQSSAPVRVSQPRSKLRIAATTPRQRDSSAVKR